MYPVLGGLLYSKKKFYLNICPNVNLMYGMYLSNPGTILDDIKP